MIEMGNLPQHYVMVSVSNQTVNRGGQFYFAVKNSQDRSLTHIDTRVRLARMETGWDILSPTTGEIDQIGEEFVTDQDISFDNETMIDTHSFFGNTQSSY